MWDPTSVREENKAFFIRVWKPLSSRHVLKTLRGSPKGKTQTGQYLLGVGLDHYKWYQRQTPCNVSKRRLNPEGGGHEAVCQQERWAPKGCGLGVIHQLEEGTSASENAGPRRGVDCEIPHRLGRRTTFFIRVWKPLPIICVLKTLRESPRGKTSKEDNIC